MQYTLEKSCVKLETVLMETVLSEDSLYSNSLALKTNLSLSLLGTTKVMATFLLQYNKTKVTLDKINFEEGNLTREDYLQSIKEAVIVQSRAQKVLLLEN